MASTLENLGGTVGTVGGIPISIYTATNDFLIITVYRLVQSAVTNSTSTITNSV